jgi:hypothetical protein
MGESASRHEPAANGRVDGGNHPPDGGNQRATDKHWWNHIKMGGFFSGIISGLIVAFALTPTGHASGTYILGRDPRPNCSNPQWLLKVPDDQIFASSYYFTYDTIPLYGILHDPSLSIDGNLRTAWLQWWPTTDLNNNIILNSNITWTFPNSYNIRLICIIDGWTEDSHTYAKTLPIGSATIYSAIAGSTPPRASPLCAKRAASFTDYIQKGDSYQWQGFEFSCKTKNVTLAIDGVSKASEKARDKLDLVPDTSLPGNAKEPLVGISEINFYYAPSVLSHLPY